MAPSVTRDSHTILYLSDIIVVSGEKLVGAASADTLLRIPRQEQLAGAVATMAGAGWLLPADARWQEITVNYIEDAVIRVRFRGETRRFEPEDLGLRNRKNGMPLVGWTLLRTLARCDGELSWKDAGASTRIKKQKQLLSRALKTCFGIEDDPIVWRGKAYRARFVIKDSTRSAPAGAGKRR